MRASTHTVRAGGFSLVELMGAVTISIIMFAVIIELFINNKEAYRLQEGASVSNENARYAVSHLQFFMRLADHWGGVQPANVSVDGGVPALGTDCGGSPVISNVGFRGYNGAATRPVDCIVAANYEPNTDAFFIRYGSAHEDGYPDTGSLTLTRPVLNGVPKLPEIDEGEQPITRPYVTTDPDGAGIWLRTALGRRAVIYDRVDFASLPSDIIGGGPPDERQFTNYRFQSMLYYIRACGNPQSGTNANACDADDDGVPTLVRMTLNPDLSFTEQDIVTGVENMQLLYGVDTDNDFVAERYDTAATVQAAGNWPNVVSVRVSLIVANLERDNTVNDTGTYFMLDTSWVPPAEARNFRRRQYEFTIQIRNMTRA